MSAVPGSRARWALLLGVVAPLLLTTPALAEESTPVGPSAAAWFPRGIGSVIAATYPADTLHVGAALGLETDRTYLRFELSSLPDDAEVESVTIVVPADPDAGTTTPEVAVILGCAVPGGFDPDAATPPEVDCEGAPQATFLAGVAPAFTLSLPAPTRGAVVDVALVPGGGETWHVGFDGPGGDAPPMAAATYDEPSPEPAPAAPAASPPVVVPPAPSPVALPPLTVPAPVASGGAIADEATVPAPPVVAVPAGSTSGFRYAAVFALPLALLVVVALLGDGLTRPVRLREDAT